MTDERNQRIELSTSESRNGKKNGKLKMLLFVARARIDRITALNLSLICDAKFRTLPWRDASDAVSRCQHS